MPEKISNFHCSNQCETLRKTLQFREALNQIEFIAKDLKEIVKTIKQEKEKKKVFFLSLFSSIKCVGFWLFA